MNWQDKEEFLGTLTYFWQEKGHVGFTGFSIEKLREADPVLADAYERMDSATETFSRLLKEKEQS